MRSTGATLHSEPTCRPRTIPQLELFLEAPAPDLEARLRAAGLPPSLRVTLHTNRRTMVSIERGGGLRVHLGYASAPDEVIRAIVFWARTGRQAHRRMAARILLGFPAVQHAPPPSSGRPRRRPAPAARPSPRLQAWLGRLRQLHASLDARHFGGVLGPVDLVVSTRMRRRLGHFEPGLAPGEPHRIVLSRRHIMRDGWAAAADTLLHEMVHQWQHQSGLPLDHGPTFRRKALEVGIEPAAVWTRTD